MRAFVRACVCVRVFVCLWFVCVLNVFLRRLSRPLVCVHVTCLPVNVHLHVHGVRAYVRARVC